MSDMLQVMNDLPPRMLEIETSRLHQVLSGPTLFHLPGRREEPLFISVLLHGNEDTGWYAVQSLLRNYRHRELPRALSIFVGNVAAGRAGVRFLDGQPDYNRIWEDVPGVAGVPEREMMRRIVEEMRARNVFASIDVHNNSGINPHYACVRRLDHPSFQLATLFSRTVVYFTRPRGVQTAAFSELCPAVTVECGQAGQAHGVNHATEYLDACLNLAAIPEHKVAVHDIDLFHSVAIVKVPDDVSFGFGEDVADIRFAAGLDYMNFRELPPGTLLGWVKDGSKTLLHVQDEQGSQVSGKYLKIENGEIRTAVPVMPSMLTSNAEAIRQDCLCYFMERHRGFYESAA
jgi:succinylglutamate desuccinylase